jgi:hypothetical protein
VTDFRSFSPTQALLYIILIAFCVAPAATAAAQNQYYVAPNGLDSNDGSMAHPWATINHADAALTVGTPGTCTAGSGWATATGVGACVHVSAGTYAGTISTSTNGNSSARIRYVSDTKYGARLTGGGNQIIWAISGSFTDVVGFDVDGSASSAAVYGIAVQPPATNALVLQNKVHDIAKVCNSEGTAAVQSTATSTTNFSHDNDFESNLIYHNNCGAGGSTTFGDAHTGLSLQQNDIARNNIIVDQGGGWCLQSAHSSTNNIVTNNSLINCDRGGIILNNFNGTNDFTTVSDNIIVNSGANGGNSGIRLYGSSACGPHNIYANNLLYGNSPQNFDAGSCSNTSTGTLGGNNTTTFANYTGTVSGDYHLKSGSTAIASSTTACAIQGLSCIPATDFDGNLRPQNASDSVGAYQYTATNGPTPPGLRATVE